MKRKKELLILAILLLGGLFFLGDRVSAVDTSNFGAMMTITPPTEKILLVPGEVYEGVISVSNSANATKDLEYSVRVGSFNLGKDENGNVDYDSTDIDTVTSYNQMVDWITLDKESGSVSPHTADKISYKINVPKDAPAGGQYASIVFRDNTGKDNKGEGNVTIEDVVEFAVGIFAKVAGDTRDEGEILDNSIPAFLLNNQLSTSSLVKNEGNVHTDAEYVLQVWPLFSDEEICTNEEKPETSMILPDTERYHTQTCDLPSVGIFRAAQKVKIFEETSVVEKIVIVCPLWLLFLIVFVIVALIIWIAMKVKKKDARESRTQ